MKDKRYIEIMNRIYAHYDYVCEQYGKEHILGVFAYGSMNYGTYIDGQSDVDTKAIYVPTLDEALFQKPISKELHIGNEHCELKDIREMFNMFRKQNVNFVETLFTLYYTINPQYIDLWEAIENESEDIARYNPVYCVKSICGQVINTIKQMDKLESGTKEWYKKASNIQKFQFFLEHYIDKKPYQDCLLLSGRERDVVLDIKKGLIMPGPGALSIQRQYFEDMQKIAETELAGGDNEPLDNFLNNMTKDAILLCDKL